MQIPIKLFMPNFFSVMKTASRNTVPTMFFSISPEKTNKGNQCWYVRQNVWEKRRNLNIDINPNLYMVKCKWPSVLVARTQFRSCLFGNDNVLQQTFQYNDSRNFSVFLWIAACCLLSLISYKVPAVSVQCSPKGYLLPLMAVGACQLVREEFRV